MALIDCKRRLGVAFVFGVLAGAGFAQRGGIGALPGPVPTCNAGPNLVSECTGATTVVALDGTASTNPLPGALIYRWEFCNNPSVAIDDPTSATPNLYVDLSEGCQLTCQVWLVVRNKNGSSECSITVTVRDTTPPVIQCPPDLHVDEGGATDPGSTGFASATDVCNASPAVTYTDDLSQAPSILRTWTADDGCESSSCVQFIQVGPLSAHLDLKPGECPNPIWISDNAAAVINIRASLLGNDFDVTQVDLTSLSAERLHQLVPEGLLSLPPHETQFHDIATPYIGDPCGCHTLAGDGLLDLTLYFHREDFIAGLQLGGEPNGSVLELRITGQLLNGIPFVATDCMTIINPGN